MSPCYHSKYLLIIVTFILIWEIKSTRWLVLCSLLVFPGQGPRFPQINVTRTVSIARTTIYYLSRTRRQIVQPRIYLYIFPTLFLALAAFAVSVATLFRRTATNAISSKIVSTGGVSCMADLGMLLVNSSSPFLSLNWNPTLSVIGGKFVYTENIQTDIYLANLLWQKVVQGPPKYQDLYIFGLVLERNKYVLLRKIVKVDKMKIMSHPWKLQATKMG